MKLRIRDHSDRRAQSTASPTAGPSPGSPRRSRALIAVAFVALLMTAAFVGRHAIAGLVLPRAASFISGERVTLGDFRIGWERSVFRDVHVRTAGGDPLFDAQAITLGCSLRGLIFGGSPRLGLSGVQLDRPIFSVVRRRDGSYNVADGGQRGSTPASNAASAAPPWKLGVSVHHGEIRLIDRAPVTADLSVQQLADLEVGAHIDSARRSTATGSARFVSRQTAKAALRSWPVALTALLDAARGIGIARIGIPALPLRGPIGFLQHSSAVRVDDGVLRGVDLQWYALAGAAGKDWNAPALSGRGDLVDGRLAIAALRRPVTEMRGRLRLADAGVWSTRLDARIAGVPVVARGGAFDRFHPTLRLGVAADGELSDLRHLFAFSTAQPVSGRTHLETLLEAPVASLLVRTALRAQRGRYLKVPLTDLVGRVDYHAGAVVLDGLRVRYGAAALAVGGRFLLGGGAPDSVIAATGSAPGAALPYGENIAPDSNVNVVTVLTGGRAGYRARGAVGIGGQGTAGEGLFAVSERGVGEFAPLAVRRPDGSSLIGALRLERPTSRSAAWVSAVRYRVAVPAHPARFAGLNVPAFPPLAGVLDGAAVGAGTPAAFALSGELHGTGLRVGQLALGTGRFALGGTLRDLRLPALAVTGPLGAFAGSAAVQSGTFGLRGAYAGTLERLRPLTGPLDAHGALRGAVLATVNGNDVVVQSPHAALDGGASLRGVAVRAAAGTLAVRQGRFHLITGAASLGQARAVAAESNGSIALSAPNIPAAALRGTGIPLEAGRVSAYGTADLGRGALRFGGTVAVADGRAHGYPVAGDARLRVDGSTAAISDGSGGIGSTFGNLAGTLVGIGSRTLRYTLATRIPLGDIGLLAADLHLPVRHLAGSYAADLAVGGSGSTPQVTGRISVPEGNLNGLAFRSVAARVEAAPGHLAAHDGHLTVGATTTTWALTAGGGRYALRARAPAADLADFNDYFDTAQTLAGRGSVALDLAFAPAGISSAGNLALHSLRYRGFGFDDATASWGMRGALIAGRGRLTSRNGTLELNADLIPHGGSDPRRALLSAGYSAHGTVSDVKLGTWLVAAGSSLPVEGTGDATLSLAGPLSNLAIGLDARLANASVGGLAVRSAHVRATAHGSQIRVSASDADLGFATLAGEGLLGLKPPDPLAFDLRLRTDDIGPAVRRFRPATGGALVAGSLDADVRISGTRGRPAAAGGFDLEHATYNGFEVPRAIGEIALAGKSIELRAAEVEFGRGRAFVAGSLPLQLRPMRVGPPGARLSVDVTAQTIDLAQFVPLFPTGTLLGGTLDGRFGIEGSVDRPQLVGTLALADGTYRSPLERALISHVGAELGFAGTSVTLMALHADVGKGTLDGHGRITLPSRGQPQAQYDASLAAQAATFDLPAYGRGTVDGMLDLAGSGRSPLLTGSVSLTDAVIPVSAVYGAGSATAAAGGAGLPLDPQLRVHASAGNNVRVRSGIVDIGVTGGVDLTGNLAAPQLSGGFAATDGTISSYNHVFRIVNAAVSFDPANGTVPTIEARAVSRVPNPDPDPSRNIAGAANIYVTVSGTADGNNLQVTYSSDPAYSQEQIVGLLLDVPALLGAVNFNLNGGPGAPVLRGAPGETNVLLPPGVTPEQVSVISFNQEVFSLLNGQFTQRALSPIERTFQRVLGLSDVEFTVDYGGGIGYSLRREIGKRDFSAFVSQTVTYPERVNLGFDLAPKPYERLNLSLYAQNGVTSLITNQTPGEELFGSGRRLTTVQPLGNRSGVSLNFNRRF